MQIFRDLENKIHMIFCCDHMLLDYLGGTFTLRFGRIEELFDDEGFVSVSIRHNCSEIKYCPYCGADVPKGLINIERKKETIKQKIAKSMTGKLIQYKGWRS